MNCFFKMSASKIQRRSGLKSWDMENMIQATKAVCNKEMGYLAAAKKKIKKKKTSSVYDCTVEDVEYICNSNKL